MHKKEIQNHEIRRIPGDCLCILRSFKESKETTTKYSVLPDDAIQTLREEMYTGSDSKFLSNVETKKEVEKFLLDPLRYYNCEICDMFLLAFGIHTELMLDLSSKWKRMLGF